MSFDCLAVGFDSREFSPQEGVTNGDAVVVEGIHDWNGGLLPISHRTSGASGKSPDFQEFHFLVSFILQMDCPSKVHPARRRLWPRRRKSSDLPPSGFPA